MNKQNLVSDVNAGTNTVSELESQYDVSRATINNYLTDLVSNGTLNRERNGHEYEYTVSQQSESVSTVDADSQSELLPVDREYEFSRRISEPDNPYIPSDDELVKILSSIELREETGKKPRFLIGGPTGCGKTHLAEYIAGTLNAPLFTIQGKWAMNEADLLGNPSFVGDTSWWVDGELTKAIISSQEQPTVLMIDEINRARPDSKGILYPALDDRCEVRLDMRGGEVITGNSLNLIVIATINEGSGYYTEEMDLAEIRRVSTKLSLDYLGFNKPELETDLLCERTPIPRKIAEVLVKASNHIRGLASDEESAVHIGIPTASLISWAQEAYSYDKHNLENPLMEAARSTVINPYYDTRPEAKTRVTEVIGQNVNNAPLNLDQHEEWASKDIKNEISQRNIHS